MTHFTTNYNDNNYLRSAKKYSSELKKLVKNQSDAEAEAERKPNIVSKNNKADSSEANIYKMEEYLTEAELQCDEVIKLAYQVGAVAPVGRLKPSQHFINMYNHLTDKLTRFVALFNTLIHFFEKQILKNINEYQESDLTELRKSVRHFVNITVSSLMDEPMIIALYNDNLIASRELEPLVKQFKEKFNQAVKTFKSSSIEEIGAGISHGGIADSLHFKLHSKEFINSPYKRYW